MNEIQGFEYEGKRIFYIDPQGKDISFDRWRATLYYEPHMAMTAFFPTLAAYDVFLHEHIHDTYMDYQCYRDAVK